VCIKNRKRGAVLRALELVVALVLSMPLSALSQAAEASVPTREATLENDITGPTVEWVGMVEESLRDGDDTCFILRKVQPYIHSETARENFIACHLGSFDPAAFGAGRNLQVKGNLGAAIPRLIGGQIYALPVIAAASIQLAIEHPKHNWPPPYYGPYNCDPFWYPWHHHFDACWP
jgi:starvation-inducible outer membrane lipoprotein